MRSIGLEDEWEWDAGMVTLWENPRVFILMTIFEFEAPAKHMRWDE
jgi:hypothetical protein